MGEVGAAYAGCRARIADLARPLDEVAAATRVPTCPAWSVLDVVAHLAGVVDDALAGRLEGVATDPWTAAQVQARRDQRISDILSEWDAKAPSFEGILDGVGNPGRQAVADVVTHEHDVRAALGVPGARDTDAVHIGLGFVVPAFVDSAAARGISLRVRALGVDDFGREDAPIVLSGQAFELLRAMTGRRSVAQLRELQWEGSPDTALPAFTFGPFTPAANPINE